MAPINTRALAELEEIHAQNELIVVYSIARRRRRRQRRVWVRQVFLDKAVDGDFHNLLVKLRLGDAAMFHRVLWTPAPMHLAEVVYTDEEATFADREFLGAFLGIMGAGHWPNLQDSAAPLTVPITLLDFALHPKRPGGSRSYGETREADFKARCTVPTTTRNIPARCTRCRIYGSDEESSRNLYRVAVPHSERHIVISPVATQRSLLQRETGEGARAGSRDTVVQVRPCRARFSAQATPEEQAQGDDDEGERHADHAQGGRDAAVPALTAAALAMRLRAVNANADATSLP
ncbi:hypothetical protein HPB51_008666 [Rhipicephalus microplus]|uniref:Uncharacterized protein n=1 Tax=Rhipicephalus microplus TaxID=6941 RepID=A0A9J6E8A3_RHIMP|nr:hypothetical protein HPB51_008666 [Rhipicephalus microplus]